MNSYWEPERLGDLGAYAAEHWGGREALVFEEGVAASIGGVMKGNR